MLSGEGSGFDSQFLHSIVTSLTEMLLFCFCPGVLHLWKSVDVAEFCDARVELPRKTRGELDLFEEHADERSVCSSNAGR